MAFLVKEEACVVLLKRFVESAQRLGFSMAEHKLNDVREELADLMRLEVALSNLVFACRATKENFFYR